MKPNYYIISLFVVCVVAFSGCKKEDVSNENNAEIETIVLEEYFSNQGDWLLTADSACEAKVLDSSLILIADNLIGPEFKAYASLDINPYDNSKKVKIRIQFVEYYLSSYDYENTSNYLCIGLGSHKIESFVDSENNNMQSVHFNNGVLELIVDVNNNTFTASGGEHQFPNETSNFFKLSPNPDNSFYISFSTNAYFLWSAPGSDESYSEIESIVISTIK